MASVPLILSQDFIDNPGSGTMTLTLSSVVYRLRLVWDNRANGGIGAWRHDLRTSDGTAVLLGRKLLLTDDVWAGLHYKDDVPPGALRLYRTDGSEADPGLNDLGTNVLLEYVT